MERAGQSRRHMADVLNAAYGDGLLSEHTLAHRLEVLFGSMVVEPAALVGDLTLRSPRRALAETLERAAHTVRRVAGLTGDQTPPVLLALDWTGTEEELVVGRHPACDVVLDDLSVSRRHARLTFRDGNWVLCDLSSTNGTRLNGRPVVRCRLLPGDVLRLGDAPLQID
jgi:hypothetical protein